MKTSLSLLVSILLLAACSTPKYTYYFDHYDYNSGKKKKSLEVNKALLAEVNKIDSESPLAFNEADLLASTDNKIILTEKKENDITPSSTPLLDKVLLEKKITNLSKAERKELKKELKREIKKALKSKKSDEVNSIEAAQGTKAMDHDLRMALIFGVVGLVLSLFGGVNSVFWVLSVVSIVVAVVFFIQWLARQ